MLELYTRLQTVLSSREEGQTLAEYGLILALIAVVCVLALTTLGGAIAATLGQIAGEL